MKKNEALLCFDKYDIEGKKVDTKLYGIDDNSEHRRIEFIVMPCLTYREFTLRKDKQNITCKGDLSNFSDVKAETETFLKDAEIVTVFNQAKFNNTRFDKEMIIKDSRASSIPFTAAEPSWVQMVMTGNAVADEIDLLNTGLTLAMTDFITLEMKSQQKTGFTDFKKNYKYISLQVNVNDI